MCSSDLVDVQLGDLLTSDPTIGDVWFDQALGGRLVVSLTNADSRVRQAIRDLMPANSLGLEFRDADYGLAKLAAAARRFDAAWTDTTGLLPPVSIAVGQGRVGIDGGMGAIVERIYGESWPYGILPQVGTWEGQPLCASLAVTDYTTASDGIKCGIVRNVVSYWQSESGPWRVHGASMDLSGSSGPISGDSGSPIYMRYDSDSGNRRIPVGVVDHEFIPCGPMTPGETYVHTNDCGRDLYFAEVNEVMAEWPTWSIWTGS